MLKNPKEPRASGLFGTDGIRGRAGAAPLDPDTVIRLGHGLVQTLAGDSIAPRILIGLDTRESGSAIAAYLCHGIRLAGGEPIVGGVLPTAAVALLTVARRLAAGVVISASHNSFEDNGLKFFSADGHKLSDFAETAMEQHVVASTLTAGDFVAASQEVDERLAREYLTALMGSVRTGFSLKNCHLAIDCGNGSAHAIAPELFRALGATVTSLGSAPNGRNINEKCGSQHPSGLVAAVRATHAMLGIAFDGDADRCVLVDELGGVCDGDDLLAVAATIMNREGSLGPAGVVGTVMANYGLARYLTACEIPFVRTAVGDRHVLAEMRRRDARLGGEQSGHVIFREHATTGDGILTALLLVQMVVQSGQPLSQLRSCWTRLPQVLHNVVVSERRDLQEVPQVRDLIAEVSETLGDRGRVLVRYSGTEPLVRIMLEGPDANELNALAASLVDTVKSSLTK